MNYTLMLPEKLLFFVILTCSFIHKGNFLPNEQNPTGEMEITKANLLVKNLDFIVVKHGIHEQFVYISQSNSSNYLRSMFSTNRPVKLLVHGWSLDLSGSLLKKLARKYAQRGKVNVMLIDWSKVMIANSYQSAVSLTSFFGLVIAEMVNKLVQYEAFSLSSVHIIGLGLGAHIAGEIGSQIKAGAVGRITGLDPSLPLYRYSSNRPLSSSDADFVDVIHTTSGTLGQTDHLGHADFYPNGGYFPQRGCFINTPFQQMICSHKFALLLFIESISNPLGFKAVQCPSYWHYVIGECHENQVAYMGEGLLKTTGKYYLTTNFQPPYAKGVTK